ncbi:MAG TPA: MFS transporter [Bryobacteraceae bacterium]|nr:MFS transporter [Bryobacteraceae bacterium]
MKIPGMRWVIAAMLFLATTVNYCDRLALSVVSTDIRHEFHMNEQDYSEVVSIFLIAYAVMYAGSGYVVDRLGTRRGFAVFIFVWSAAAMLHGLAFGMWSLAACRFLLGLAEPGNWPAAAKAVAEWFPARQRALGVGIFNAGSSLGSAIAPPVVTFMTLHYGWRSAFYFTGAFGVVWLIFWLILYQPPFLNRWLRADEYAAMKDEVEAPSEAVAAPATRVSWWKVLGMRECYTLILARFFTDPVIYFVIFWLPEYLRKERHFDLAMLGTYASVPFIFGGIGYVTGGWLSGRLMRAGWSLPRARKFVMLLGAAVMPAAILAPGVPAAWMAILATCFITLGHAFWTANLQAIPTDLFRGGEMGTATGFSGMGGALGGILANYGTGWVVAHFSYAPVFLMAGLMHPLAIGIVYKLLPDSRFARATRA